MIVSAAPGARPNAPGFSDSLGNRTVSGTAATGLLETLEIRPELVAVPAFEAAVREGIARLSSFMHPACGRVRRLERRGGNGGLILTSDYIEGNRLSEILLIAEHQRIQLNTSAILDILQQVVQVTQQLHDHVVGGFLGVLGPERIVIRPNARAVVVEHVFGPALRRLPPAPPSDIWHTFRLAVPADQSLPQFGPLTDLVQVGAIGLSLLLGRQLRAFEYPAKVLELLAGATETDLVGRRRPVSRELRHWIVAMLQVDPERRFKSITEASHGLDALLADENRYIAGPIALEALLRPRHHRIRVVRRHELGHTEAAEPKAGEESAPETPSPEGPAASELPPIAYATGVVPVEPHGPSSQEPVTVRPGAAAPDSTTESVTAPAAADVAGEAGPPLATESGDLEVGATPEPEITHPGQEPLEPGPVPVATGAPDTDAATVGEAGAATDEPAPTQEPPPTEEMAPAAEPAVTEAALAVVGSTPNDEPVAIVSAVASDVLVAGSEPAAVGAESHEVSALVADASTPTVVEMPEEPVAVVAATAPPSAEEPSRAAVSTPVEDSTPPLADLLLTLDAPAPESAAPAWQFIVKQRDDEPTSGTSEFPVLRNAEPLPDDITAVHTSGERLVELAEGRPAPSVRPEPELGAPSDPAAHPFWRSTAVESAAPVDAVENLADAVAKAASRASEAAKGLSPKEPAPKEPVSKEPVPKEPALMEGVPEAPNLAGLVPKQPVAPEPPTLSHDFWSASERVSARGADQAEELSATDEPLPTREPDTIPIAPPSRRFFEVSALQSDRRATAASSPRPTVGQVARLAEAARRRRRILGVAAVLVVLAAGTSGTWWWIQASKPTPTGTLSIESQPSGAEVRVDGQVKGKTPLSLTLTAGRHNVEARGIGDPRKATVDIEQDRSISHMFTFDVPALTGSLRVSSQQPGIGVKVDGEPRGSAPLTIDDLPLGIHTVTLSGSFGETSHEVTIEAAKTSELNAELSTWVRIQSALPLQVSEKGRLLGSSNKGPIALSPGIHRLEFSNEQVAYRGAQVVDLGVGKTTTLKVDLPSGLANLNATPWAEVYIDGQKVGETPIASLSLPVGPHTVLFRNPQFGEQQLDITVTLASPVRLSVDLRK